MKILEYFYFLRIPTSENEKLISLLVEEDDDQGRSYRSTE